MSDLDTLRAIADDGCPHSPAFRRELLIAILAVTRRLPAFQRRRLAVKRGAK